eukprot:1155977-Pelagomonas_calceolata.AAC.2
MQYAGVYLIWTVLSAAGVMDIRPCLGEVSIFVVGLDNFEFAPHRFGVVCGVRDSGHCLLEGQAQHTNTFALT